MNREVIATDLLRVEQALVCSLSDLVHHTWLQVNKHGPGHVLAAPSLGEEGGEAVISSSIDISLHGAVRLKTCKKTFSQGSSQG